MTRIFAFLLGLCLCTSLATPLAAQTYPERTGTGMNDFADLITPEIEAHLLDKLNAIAADHDTEVAIVTLSSLRFYAQDSTIEDYATGLFNTWGIGDATDDTGLLLIVFRDDRELRIAAGEGYDTETRKEFDRVIDEDVLPPFRSGDYAAGIEAGVDGLLTRVIAPATAPVPASSDTTPQAAEGGGNTLLYVLGGLVAAIAGVVFLNRRAAAKFAAQECTSCGKTGLTREREVLRPATVEAEGASETRITCPSCGHVETKTHSIAKLKPEAPKGGGQTKGSGATGKW